MGPEDIVQYWVDSHPSSVKHTIGMVIDFAKAKEHKVLQHEFDKLISGECEDQN